MLSLARSGTDLKGRAVVFSALAWCERDGPPAFDPSSGRGYGCRITTKMQAHLRHVRFGLCLAAGIAGKAADSVRGCVDGEQKMGSNNKGQLLQDPFLNILRKDHIPVSIYLVNGIKLQGQIESFDQYVVLLRNTVTQMVYKHAISTVVPTRAVNMPSVPEE